MGVYKIRRDYCNVFVSTPFWLLLFPSSYVERTLAPCTLAEKWGKRTRRYKDQRESVKRLRPGKAKLKRRGLAKFCCSLSQTQEEHSRTRNFAGISKKSEIEWRMALWRVWPRIIEAYCSCNLYSPSSLCSRLAKVALAALILSVCFCIFRTQNSAVGEQGDWSNSAFSLTAKCTSQTKEPAQNLKDDWLLTPRNP